MGIDGTALYDTGANLSYVSYTCYINLKDPIPLKNVPAMSVHSATGYGIFTIGKCAAEL